MVDAMILPKQTPPTNAMRLTRAAVQRRDYWSSRYNAYHAQFSHELTNVGFREEARQLFVRMPFFSAWHPAVLELYLELGLHEDPKGGVALTTPRMQVSRLKPAVTQN